MPTTFKKVPRIAIVGRANVGKSTLFNCLIEKPKALVSSVAGTTRDRNYGSCFWRGKELILIDTGGLVRHLEEETKKQVDIAIAEADLILFVVDLRGGLVNEDRQFAKLLLKTKKPIILVGNKADSFALRERAEEPDWLKFGLGKPAPVSAVNGSGTGDLLDEIISKIKKLKIKSKPQKISLIAPPIKVAIIGKPNVGKSSLLNAILGEEKVLVSEIPFTTRQPQDTIFIYNDQPFLLIDTAGIRKKTKIEPGLEKVGVKRSVRALEGADVALLVTEAHLPLARQDSHLAGLILEKKTGIIIIANKWDIVGQKDTKITNRFTNYYYQYFPYLKWAPILFVSAKTREKVKNILDLVLKVKNEREKNINKEELEQFLKNTLKIHEAVIHKIGRPKERPKIIGIKQTGTCPPHFLLYTLSKKILPEAFIKFIEGRLREKFGFIGTPIEMEVKQIKR
jgi:GTP-binding protein